MRNILNNILSILVYKIKRSKWLYENDKNLIATLKSQNINSIIDVGASSGQFAEQVFKNGFKGLIYSFEPLKKEHDIFLIKSKKNNLILTKKIIRKDYISEFDRSIILNNLILKSNLIKKIFIFFGKKIPFVNFFYFRNRR